MKLTPASFVLLLAGGASFLSVVSALGCASSDDAAPSDPRTPSATADTGEAPSTPSTDDEIRASCTSPRRYFVTYGDDRACMAIEGQRGQWIPEPLFADAPADVQTSTCAYRWSGAKYSRPDREAITAAVGATNGLAPACGSTSEPDVGLLEPIPYIDILGHAGAAGCDVCGIVRNDRIWVVLPPEKIALKQFEVQLSNGEKRAFQIENTSARALSIALPAPPSGTAYAQGRVPLY